MEPQSERSVFVEIVLKGPTYKRGEYYYLFASIGTCCNGATSTYQTVVGRSKNVLGPYLDKTGRDMLYDYCEIIMEWQ